MATVELRMLRLKVIEALSNADDWRVVSETRLERISDGLWLVADRNRLAIGSPPHGIPQAELDYEYTDRELVQALAKVRNVGNGAPRARRPIFDLLGVTDEIDP